MKSWFTRHDSAAPIPLDDQLPGAARPLALASRSCCCPARPGVTVIMPPSAGRHRVELLLCGHHYRISEAALEAAGAAVYDKTGVLIMTGAGHSVGVLTPGPLALRRFTGVGEATVRSD